MWQGWRGLLALLVLCFQGGFDVVSEECVDIDACILKIDECTGASSAFSGDGSQFVCINEAAYEVVVYSSAGTRLYALSTSDTKALPEVVAISHNGDYVASAHNRTNNQEEFHWRMWDAKTKKELWRMNYTHVPTSLIFSPDGHLVVSDDAVVLFYKPTGEHVRTFSISFQSVIPQSLQMPLTDTKVFYVSSTQGLVLKNSHGVDTPFTFHLLLTNAALSPDGTQFTSAYWGKATVDVITISTKATSTLVHTPSTATEIVALSYSSDGTTLVTVSQGGASEADIFFWSVATQQLLQHYYLGKIPPIKHVAFPYDVVPKGMFIFSSEGGATYLWEMPAFPTVPSTVVPPPVSTMVETPAPGTPAPRSEECHDIKECTPIAECTGASSAFSGDGSQFVCINEAAYEVVVYSSAGTRLYALSTSDTKAMPAVVAMSRNGSYVAGGYIGYNNVDYRLQLWDAKARVLMWNISYDYVPSSLIFSPDDTVAAVIKDEVLYFNISGTLLDTASTFPVTVPSERSLGMSATDPRLSIIAQTGRAALVFSGSGHEEFFIRETGVTSAALSPDGAHFARGKDGGNVKITTIATKETVLLPHPTTVSKVQCMAYSRDGTVLVTATQGQHLTADIFFWDVATQTLLRSYYLGIGHPLTDIAFPYDVVPNMKFTLSTFNGLTSLWEVPGSTAAPTAAPTAVPATIVPTLPPTAAPTAAPTVAPTSTPTTDAPQTDAPPPGVLSLSDGLLLEWYVDRYNNLLHLFVDMTCGSATWCAVGFGSSMADADTVTCLVTSSDVCYDGHSDRNAQPTRDASQSIFVVDATPAGSRTTRYTFHRTLVAAHDNPGDTSVKVGLNDIIWAVGPEGGDISTKHVHRGNAQILVVAPDTPAPQNTTETPDTDVPAVDTAAPTASPTASPTSPPTSTPSAPETDPPKTEPPKTEPMTESPFIEEDLGTSAPATNASITDEIVPTSPPTTAPAKGDSAPTTAPKKATPDTEAASGSGSNESVVIIIMAVVAAVLLSVLGCCVWFVMCRRRRWKPAESVVAHDALQDILMDEILDLGKDESEAYSSSVPMGSVPTGATDLIKTCYSNSGSLPSCVLPVGPDTEGPEDPMYLTWRKLKRLGEGAYGVVYAGSVESGRLVAMKEQFGATREDVNEARSVLRILQRLKHPHITQMYDMVYSPREMKLCVLMELVEGTSLGGYVRSLPSVLAEEKAAFYMHQVLQALHFLHSSNVVHRDIKGDNVLLTPEGVAKLCDFGSVKEVVHEATPSIGVVSCANTQVGTPNWIAPEVFGSGTHFTKAGTPADIFSVGCTVAEILNRGKPPGDAPQKTRWAAYVSPPVYPPSNLPGHVSDAASALINACLQQNPDDRPTAGTLLDHRFISLWTESGITLENKDVLEAQLLLSKGQMRDCVRMKPALGRGSYGVVHLASVKEGRGKIVDVERHVAVKELHLPSSHSGEARVKVEQEFELMQSLHHANIVQYLGHMWRDAGCLEIFMEYMSGGSVKSLIRSRGRGLDADVVVQYTRQVLEGLAYLHKGELGRAPIAHRDVKGDNLLLSVDAVVKLSDFGCSKIFGEEADNTFAAHGAQTCVGTPFWMAPEVLERREGVGEYGTRCDIWSLGCTVVEMFGHTPWMSGSRDAAFEVVNRILSSDGGPPLPASVPPDMVVFLELCFQRDPSARPSAASLLRSHVFGVLF